MTTVEITLPDQLAREAAQAGLLTAEAIEALLRERLRRKHIDELFGDDLTSIEGEAGYMSPEDVAEEIAIMRAERRALSHAG